MKAARKYRDLTLAPVPGGTVVIAADSCASAGSKPADHLQCPAYHVGRVSARVVLFELFCIGARVLVVADGICAEMEPTGREIIRGYTDELALAGLSGDCLTGSTEENFPTAMTGVGTAAVGYLAGDFTPPACHPGDILACLGTPLVGMAFLHFEGQPIATYDHLARLGSRPDVRELVPVGSKGVAWEAANLARLHGLAVDLDPRCPLDLAQSGGPSTCVVVAADPRAWAALERDFPVTRIGTLVRGEG